MKNTKKSQALFVKSAKEIILAAGAKVVAPLSKVNFEEFILETPSNKLHLYLYGVGHHEYLYTVFMRYETPLPNRDWNSTVGKCNFHVQTDVDSAVQSFEYFLNTVIKRIQ